MNNLKLDDHYSTAATAMSSETDAKKSKAFLPLESNPEVMTSLMQKLGVPESLEYTDVYSIDDPDLIAFVPRPSHALLFVFPISETNEAPRVAEDASVAEYNGSGSDEPVIWFKQTVPNASGIIGLLHSVSNGEARNLIVPGSDLDELLKKAVPLKPVERADLLNKCESLKSARATPASQGDTEAPKADDEADLHFVAFVKGSDGRLWDLDGRRKGPLDRGVLGEGEDALSEKALELGVRKFLKTEATAGNPDLRFSLLSLGPALDDY